MPLETGASIETWPCYSLSGHARSTVYAGQPLVVDDLDGTIYAIDSTTIELCLSLFPWAHFRTTKAAIKIPTLLDLRGPIPTLVHVTDGKVHDVNWLDNLSFERGCFYIVDSGYIDFERLARIHRAGAYFVTRAKSNLGYYCCHSQPVSKEGGLICDQIIRLTSPDPKSAYPDKLRRIVYVDPDTSKRLAFLSKTSTFPLSRLLNSTRLAGRSSCQTIADLGQALTLLR